MGRWTAFWLICFFKWVAQPPTIISLSCSLNFRKHTETKSSLYIYVHIYIIIYICFRQWSLATLHDWKYVLPYLLPPTSSHYYLASWPLKKEGEPLGIWNASDQHMFQYDTMCFNRNTSWVRKKKYVCLFYPWTIPSSTPMWQSICSKLCVSRLIYECNTFQI